MRRFMTAALCALVLTAGVLVAEPSADPMVTKGLAAYYPCNGSPESASGDAYELYYNDAFFGEDRFGNEERAYWLAGDVLETPILPKGTIPFWLKCGDEATMSLISSGDPQNEFEGFELFCVKEDDLWGLHPKDDGYKFKAPAFSGLLSYTGDPMRYLAGKVCQVAMPVRDLFDGTWHHLAISGDGSRRLVVWLDGRLVSGYISTRGGADSLMPTYGTWTERKSAPFVLPKALTSGEREIYIGTTAMSDPKYAGLNRFQNFNGYVDDIRIYDRTLRTSEVRELAEDI